MKRVACRNRVTEKSKLHTRGMGHVQLAWPRSRGCRVAVSTRARVLLSVLEPMPMHDEDGPPAALLFVLSALVKKSASNEYRAAYLELCCI